VRKARSKTIGLPFRERTFGEILRKKLRHPKVDKNYKATLPGPPGWQYKIDPGK